MANVTRFLLVWLMLVALALPSFGATYYVGTNGSDAYAGSASEPWLTWQHAADTVVAGDTVLGYNGSYTDPGVDTVIAISSENGDGTWLAPVTYQAKYPGMVYLDGDWRLENCINIAEGAHDIVLDGLEMGENQNQGILAHAASNITMTRLDVAANGTTWANADRYVSGMTLNYTTNVTLDRCCIHDTCQNVVEANLTKNHHHGVYLAGTSFTTIRNSIFYNNSLCGWGIQLGHYPQDNITIEYNTIDDYKLTPYYGSIILFYDVKDSVIRYNLFPHSRYEAIYVGAAYTYSNISINDNMVKTVNIAEVGDDGITITGNYNKTDPLVVNSANYDFRLSKYSPAIGVGSSARTHDFLGLPQHGKYADLGAYEFQRYMRNKISGQRATAPAKRVDVPTQRVDWQ